MCSRYSTLPPDIYKGMIMIRSNETEQLVLWSVIFINQHVGILLIKRKIMIPLKDSAPHSAVHSGDNRFFSNYNCEFPYLFLHTIHWLSHGRRNFKDTYPLMSSSLVIFLGVVKQFWRFWILSGTECKTPAEYGPQYISTPPPPPPPQSHTVCILYCTLGRGEGGGGQREGKVEGQQYTSTI